MQKLKWQRKYLYNGRTPHTLFPHDYSSNSSLWIQNRSFKVPKNGDYIFESYFSEHTIHENTINEVMTAFRKSIVRK